MARHNIKLSYSKALPDITTTSSPSTPMPALFLASLGNPAQYANTLHSAGHVLLLALAKHLSAPPLKRERTFPGGVVSRTSTADTPIMLFQSAAFMNDSGPGVAGAWRRFAAQHAPANPLLVVLHDELELPLGRFSVKRGAGRSARGHNGLKSLLAERGMLLVDFVRVGVGIGPRPVSRDPAVVAKFVLRKFADAEKMRVEELAAPVWRALEKEAGSE